MNISLLAIDIRHILLSKRTAYSVALIAVLAIAVAFIAEYSPEGLKEALEAGAPGSAGIFELVWFENVMTMFFPLLIVGYGAFVLSDLEDADMMGLLLTRPEARLDFLARRIAATTVSFIVVFLASGILVAGAAVAIVGGMKIDVFMAHIIWLLPLCLFILGLTFFVSVPMRTTTPTVLTSFAICLVLYFTFSLLMASEGGLPSPWNPMSIGYRILVDAPVAETAVISLGYACAFFGAGSAWFVKKDI
ncbi:MAG: hypothetical protein V1934_07665 [Methanobacteriota archaeon]